MSGKKLIGIVGLARVGKDTAADYLCNVYDLHRYAFADPIKDMLTCVFGNLFRNGDRENPIEWLGKSPRQMMQTLGTEWGRGLIHPDLWVLVAGQMWQKYQKVGPSDGVVISDVRFANEAEWIRSQGGVLIQIRRKNVEQVAEHISESGLPAGLVHHIIDNDGTLYQLRRALDEVMLRSFGVSDL